MIRASLGVCFIWIVLSSGFGASERVAGTGLIEASGSAEKILMGFAKLPLEVIRSFPVWEKVDSAASELIATLAKLLFLSEFTREPDQLKGLKNEIAQMKQAVKKRQLAGHVEEMAHCEIAKKQQFIDILEAVGTRNLKLYMAN